MGPEPFPERQILPPVLRACRGLDGAASVLLFGALLVLAAGVQGGAGCPGFRPWLLGASLLAGLAEKYCALRVRLDAELFALLAQGKLDLATLDRGLARLFGRAAPPPGRDWDTRAQGALRLAKRQLVAVAGQALLLAAALLPWG